MKENPLSPHLQVYKWQLSSLLSITHRITLISSFLGKFIVIGCSWSLLFYFLAEIRHIVWDLGYGYEIKTANISGIFIFVLSLVLTFIVWVIT